MSNTKSKEPVYPFFNQRHDFETSLIVEEGIKLNDRVSKEFAEAYMVFRGIKPEVIDRVLNDPSQRRTNSTEDEDHSSSAGSPDLTV